MFGLKGGKDKIEGLIFFSNIVRTICLRWVQWTGHVTCMRETTNAYKILDENPEGKIPPGRPRLI
jgi:hypothetical protein